MPKIRNYSTSVKKNDREIQSPKKNIKGNYILGETLGEGAFAKVKLGTHIQTGEKVAIKILNKNKLFQEILDENNGKGRYDKILKEINILKRLRHKNIIQLYEIMESDSNLYIVMEYCEGKELFDYIIKKKHLPENEACRFFQQIIDGVEYLHLSNITHRDLKPENLLLDGQNRIKISDFGLSNISKDINSLLETACGTPSYAPPEMLRGDKYNGVYSDIWSCGIILYTMLVGNLPCAESKENLIYDHIMSTDSYYFPEYVSDEAIDLINNMLKIEPGERYNFEQIKSHPWFYYVEPKLKPGVVYGVHKIPVDENILNEIESLGYDKIKCKKSLQNYKYDSFCSIYYLILQKFIREKKQSISDLFSDEYINYLKDYKHWIKPQKINDPLFLNYEVEIPLEEKLRPINSIESLTKNICIIEPISEEESKFNKSNDISTNKEKIDKIVVNHKKIKKNSIKNKIFNNEVRDKQILLNIKENKKNVDKNKYNLVQKYMNKTKEIAGKNSFMKNNKKKKVNFSFEEGPKNNKKLDILENKPKNVIKNKRRSFDGNKKYKNIIKLSNVYPNKVNRINSIDDKYINKLKDKKKVELLNSIKNKSEERKEMNKTIYKNLYYNNLNYSLLNSFREKNKTKFTKNDRSSIKKSINKQNSNILNFSEIVDSREKDNLINEIKLEEDTFKKDLNLIDSITNDTTISSNCINDNNNNSNLVTLMAKKFMKNSIFFNYLIQNNKKKNYKNIELGNKFYTLQKYKNIINIIESIKNLTFQKKYINFNYETFEEYLNEGNDIFIDKKLLMQKGIKNFINHIKKSLHKNELSHKKSQKKFEHYNKFNNLISNSENDSKLKATTTTNFILQKNNIINFGYQKLQNIYPFSSKLNKKLIKNRNLKWKHIDTSFSSMSYNNSINRERKRSSLSKTIQYTKLSTRNRQNLIKVKTFNKSKDTKNMSTIKNETEDKPISFVHSSLNSNKKNLILNSSDIVNKDDYNQIYSNNINIVTPQIGGKMNKYDNDDDHILDDKYITSIDHFISKNSANMEKSEEFKYEHIHPNIINEDEKNNIYNNNFSIEEKKEDINIGESILPKEEIKIKNANSNQIKNKNIGKKSSNKINDDYYKKYLNKEQMKILPANIPLDLNYMVNIPINQITSKIKIFSNKNGYSCNIKNNVIKLTKFDKIIEIELFKVNSQINYISTNIKSNGPRKEKDKIRKLLAFIAKK